MSRKHSEWSASAAERNFACPGALTLIGATKEGKSSPQARQGTMMHTVIESCLRSDREPYEFIGQMIAMDDGEGDLLCDEEMADAAKVCVEYVRSKLDGCRYWCEETFDLGPLGFPIPTGGTSDVCIWNPRLKELEVVDFKGGRGHYVEIHDNPQLPHYALGMLVKHPELPVERVRMTIVQPRIRLESGPVRSIVVHPADLVDFANHILEAQQRSRAAAAAFQAIKRDAIEINIWSQEWLNPGEHCTFCPAAGQCPALRAKAQELVSMHWEDDSPVVPVAIVENDPDAVERDLEAIELLEQWIAARRAYAHLLAEGGHQFANWTLVERNGHRKWNGSDETEIAKTIATDTGLSVLELWTHKLKSPAGVEKLLPGKAKKKIADLYHVPVVGKDLVRASKAGRRRPAKSLVELFFNTDTTES